MRLHVAAAARVVVHAPGAADLSFLLEHEEIVLALLLGTDGHAEAFIIGVRELHGASPVLRAVLRKVMDDFAADMAEDSTRSSCIRPTPGSGCAARGQPGQP